MKNSRVVLLLIALSIPGSLLACLWDRDTITDELKVNATDFDLIIGQFEHHGVDYYKARIKEIKLHKKRLPEDQNDLAVAYIRLKNFERAEQILLALHKEDSEKYEYLSNLGVLYKKKKDFKKSVDYMTKALKVKPEGHMGLGEWYLKALIWRRDHGKDQAVGINFLGQKYTQMDNWVKSISADKKKYRALLIKTQKLLKNDQVFADGFLLMGDCMFVEENLHLALVSYVRALELGHPNTNVVKRRMKAIFDHWDEAKMSDRSKTSEKQAHEYIGYGKKWLTVFKKTEANLIKSGSSLPGYDRVIRELDKLGVKKLRFQRK